MNQFKTISRISSEEPKPTAQVFSTVPEKMAFIVDTQVAEQIYAEGNLHRDSYTDIELVVSPPKKPGLLISKLGLLLKPKGKLYLSRELNRELQGVMDTYFENPREVGDKTVWTKK